MTTVGAPSRRPPLWVLFLGLGTLIVVAFALLRAPGAAPLAASLLYTGLSATTGLTVVAVAVRRRPAGLRGWLLLGAGQVAYAAGDSIYLVRNVVHGETSFPSAADALYLAQYPLIVAGLVLFVRRRTPGGHTATLIDSAIIAVAAGLVSWIYLIGPLTGAAGLSAAARAVLVGYPAGDLLVLVIGLRLLLGGGRRNVSYHLLLGSLVAMLAGDTTYTLLGDGSGWPCLLWLSTYTLLGGAALHPSMRQIDAPATVRAHDVTPVRLAALAAASLLAPAVLLVQYLRGDVGDVPVVAVACAALFLLVLARMAGLVATQRRIAVTDALTGLRTRGAFEERLIVEVARARRGHGLGVVLVDVDHFKRINDGHGHPAGDRVLRDLARRLRAVAPGEGLAARYGGEEFALLVPDADEDRVAAVADRVRRIVGGEGVCLDDGTCLRVTVSVGTAVLPGDAVTPQDLVQLADRALYAAKRTGRNRVVAAPPASAGQRRAELKAA